MTRKDGPPKIFSNAEDGPSNFGTLLKISFDNEVRGDHGEGHIAGHALL